MPALFITVSLISVTMAWFAYSGLTSTDVDIGVKAWNIKITRDSKPESSDITLTFSDIHPGMDTLSDIIKVNNLGDSEAQLSYSIVSARILGDPKDNYIIGTNATSQQVEDILSHHYPFHINMNLSKNFILAKNNKSVLNKTNESTFEVSVSWPLDSGEEANKDDSYWGTQAYNYTEASPIEIVIKITVEQYIEEENTGDINYPIGKEILYNVDTNSTCSTINSTCLKTNVISVLKTKEEEIISLLPDVTNSYEISQYENYDTTYNNITDSWNVNKRELFINDILNIISTDIVDSVLVRERLSNSIIGSLKYPNRFDTELNKLIESNGYYLFLNNKFDYLVSNDCYWLKSNDTVNSFSIQQIEGGNTSKMFNNIGTNSCKVIPVIEMKINKKQVN